MNEDEEIVIDHGIKIEEDEDITIDHRDPDEVLVDDSHASMSGADHPIIIETPDGEMIIDQPPMEDDILHEKEPPTHTDEIVMENIPTRPYLPDMGEMEVSSEDPSVRYFYNPYDGNFAIEGIHEILEMYIPVTTDEYNGFINKLGEGHHLYIKDGKLTVSDEPRPSPLHEWNGRQWVVSLFDWYNHQKEEALIRLNEECDAFIEKRVKPLFPTNIYEAEMMSQLHAEIKHWMMDETRPTPMTEIFCLQLGIPLYQFLAQKKLEISIYQRNLAITIARKYQYVTQINAAKTPEVLAHMTFDFALEEGE